MEIKQKHPQYDDNNFDVNLNKMDPCCRPGFKIFIIGIIDSWKIKFAYAWLELGSAEALSGNKVISAREEVASLSASLTPTAAMTPNIATTTTTTGPVRPHDVRR